MTDLARVRCIEGRWDHGYRILFEGLHGISSDQCYAILRGNAKLTGVNDLLMEADDDAEWKAKLAYHHGGVWMTHSGRYLRPYAVVTSWGSNDMIHADKITPDSDSVRRSVCSYDHDYREMAGRSLFYADDPKRDVSKMLTITGYPEIPRRRDGTVAVLFAEVQSHPFQLAPAHDTAQKALDAFLKVRGLSEYGYQLTFPREQYPVRYESEDPTDECSATQAETDFGTDAGKAVMRTNGVYRGQAIEAKKNGVTVEEIQDIEKKGTDSGVFDRRLKAMNAAFDIANNMDKYVDEWRAKIIDQAGDNWIDHTRDDGTVLRIPQAPFEHWCLKESGGEHLALPWTNVTPSGLKMINDDPNHSDWMIGAGLPIRAMLDNRVLNDEIWTLRFDYQAKKLQFKCGVLSGTGYARGEVFHPKVGDEIPDDAVIVLKRASPEFVELAMKAKAVIVERGGAMAHLVNVGREANKIIVRVENALQMYPVGNGVSVNAERGEVTLYERAMLNIWREGV